MFKGHRLKIVVSYGYNPANSMSSNGPIGIELDVDAAAEGYSLLTFGIALDLNCY